MCYTWHIPKFVPGPASGRYLQVEWTRDQGRGQKGGPKPGPQVGSVSHPPTRSPAQRTWPPEVLEKTCESGDRTRTEGERGGNQGNPPRAGSRGKKRGGRKREKRGRAVGGTPGHRSRYEPRPRAAHPKLRTPSGQPQRRKRHRFLKFMTGPGSRK